MKSYWPLIGLLISVAGCENGCVSGEPEPEVFSGPTLGAQCRPIARSNIVHPLDDSGERFFVGGRFGEHGGDVGNFGLLVTLDGGHTYRNVFTTHGSDTRGAFAYRVRQAQRGWWLGSGRLVLVVPPPTIHDTASNDFDKDWVVYSEDEGRTYDLQVAEFGTFLVPNGTPGNRRWKFGSVTIISNGDVYSVSQDSEQSWQELPVQVDLKADQVGFTSDYSWTASEDADEVLTFYGKDQFPEVEAGLRLDIARGDAEDVEEFVINFGELPAERVLSLLSREGENFRIAVLLEEESLKWPYRVLCDVGPDLEPSYVPLPEIKTLSEVQPGELATYARPSYATSGSGSTIHFLRVTPSQRVYVMTRKTLASGDFQGTSIDIFFTRYRENDVWADIRQLEAPVFASEESVGILYQKEDWSRGLRIFDMYTGEWIAEDALSSYRTIPDGKEFYGSTEGLGISFASTGLYIEPGFGSAVEIRPWTGTGNKPAALLYGGLNFISGRNLIQTRAHREDGDKLYDMYILKADAVSGQGFDPGVCVEAPDREDCAILWGTQASVILTDRDGRLVALDPDFRRLLKHRPDLGPDQWDVVVDGLHRPSDFTLIHRHGRVFALILDGDVLAVDIDSPETITRRLP